MKDRRFYLRVQRDERGKKKLNFGGTNWGAMDKRKANVRAVRTGKGLWVLDLDSKDMKVYPKQLRKLLKDIEPTVETANGYHYYFKGDGIPQTQKLLDFVDVRNEGGFVFDKVLTETDGITYKRNGKPTRPSSKLMQYLRKQHGRTESRKVEDVKFVSGTPWPKFEDGEQHDMLLRMVAKMRETGVSRDEIQSRYQEYIDTYLSDRDTRHERTLMLGALSWVEDRIDPKLNVKKGTRKLKRESTEPMSTGNKISKWEKRIRKMSLTDKAIERRAAQTYVSMFGTGMVTVLFGAAGTFKTTVMAAECVRALKADPLLKVFMWSFDATQSHENAIVELANANGVRERFIVTDGASGADYNEMVDDIIESGADMTHMMFIVDTYKHVSANVNDKQANLTALKRMKELGRLGCTVVTLAHSNKDKDKNSGTAEVEQDSDALLKIEAEEGERNYTISIKKFGRIRYDFEPRSYEVEKPRKGKGYYDIMKSVKLLDEVVDVERMVREREMLEADKFKLQDFIIALHGAGGSMTQSELYESLRDIYASKASVQKFVSKWKGRAWEAENELVENTGRKHRQMVITLNNEFVIQHNLRSK